MFHIFILVCSLASIQDHTCDFNTARIVTNGPTVSSCNIGGVFGQSQMAQSMGLEVQNDESFYFRCEKDKH